MDDASGKQNEEKLLRLNIHRGLTVKLFRGVMQFAWIVEAFFLLYFMSLMATTRIRKSWKFSCWTLNHANSCDTAQKLACSVKIQNLILWFLTPRLLLSSQLQYFHHRAPLMHIKTFVWVASFLQMKEETHQRMNGQVASAQKSMMERRWCSMYRCPSVERYEWKSSSRQRRQLHWNTERKGWCNFLRSKYFCG